MRTRSVPRFLLAAPLAALALACADATPTAPAAAPVRLDPALRRVLVDTARASAATVRPATLPPVAARAGQSAASALAAAPAIVTISPPVDLGTLGGCCSTAWDVNDAGQVVGESYTVGEIVVHGFLWTPEGGMRDLSTLGPLGDGDAIAFAINDSGQVAGFAGFPFLWTPGRGVHDLGTIGGGGGAAFGLSNAGHVVGGTYTAAGDVHAFLWTPARGMKDLGTPPDGSFSEAF